MVQPALFEAPRLSVSEFTRRIRRLIEGDPSLSNVWVQAEISNFSRPASGHLYFTLKDNGASLRCVMWKSDVKKLHGLELQDGMAVEVHGKTTVYEPGGQYQLIVDLIEAGSGEGALFAEFIRLKNKFESEGLFSDDRKRKIPALPQTIGLVTSSTGAALQDVLNVLKRRLPTARVVLSPTAVQGVDAPVSIVKALRLLNEMVKPDVIILARGGGSIEDLWAFNDEEVVRAVSSSPAPIITGVGHETDFTLVDFVSDLRAPTPTAAAELATPITVIDLLSDIVGTRRLLDTLLSTKISELRSELGSIKLGLRYLSPDRLLHDQIQRIDDLLLRSSRAINQTIMLEKTRLRGINQSLGTLNPLSILERGYSIVSRKIDGKIIHSSKNILPGTSLHVRLAAGSLDVSVQETYLEEA
ncbi:MAG: exodeoxyribonuclease VII large subunit [Chloroflexota bacterium]